MNPNQMYLKGAETPLAEINLPDDWNTRNGRPRRSGDPSTPPCDICAWNGLPDDLFKRPLVSTTHALADFQASADLGCASCAICLKILEYVGISEQWRDWMHIQKHTTSPHLQVSWVSGSGSKLTVDLVLYISEEHRRTIRGISQAPLLKGDTSSQESLEWAKSQLAMCLQSHPACRSPGSGFVPTRLISVDLADGTQDVVLMNGADVPPTSPYVALSHCWGKAPIHCITTTATLSERMARIPWESLTHTFQDAVTFTRGLGIDYLWIDSICIIQKDADDWAKESGKMLSVYENAQVTIAGVFAEDSSQGLFLRLKHGRQRQVATLRLQEGRCRLYMRYSHRFFHDWRDKHLSERSPLFTRAWTFQERLVTPRVLFFAEHELFWECFTNANCECERGLVGWKENDDEDIMLREPILPKKEFGDSVAQFAAKPTDDTDHTSGVLLGEQAQPPHQSTKLDKRRVPFWQDLVKRYSKFNLTVATDKLPAIGAIAEMVGRIRPGEKYLAGLWSSSLIEDLHWKAEKYYLPRPQPRPAPTWSWASVSSEVTFQKINLGGQDPLVEVLGVECEHNEGGAFGPVRSGRLILRGRSVICRVHGDYPPRICAITPESAILEDDWHSIFPDCGDFPSSREAYKDAVLLEISRAFNEKIPSLSRYTFLLLTPEDRGNGTYSRIGFIDTSQDFIRLERYKLFEESCETRRFIVI